MNKNVLTILSLMLVMFSACAQQKKTTASKVMTGTGEQAKTGTLQQIAMMRTSCFGTCPSYRVIVNRNGHVKYTSHSFTKYEGVYEKDFAKAEVEELFKTFEQYRVDTCKDKYESLIQDVPGIIYDLEYKNKEKQIMNAHFGPDFLSDLAKEVDKFAQVDDSWKKTGESDLR